MAKKSLIIKLIRKIRLRTYISIGIILVLAPLAFLAVYGVFGALGGSSATPSSHWAFDEGVDNTCSAGVNDACDSKGTKDAAFTAGPVWQTEDKCVSGKCIYLDGSAAQVDLPTTTVPSGAFTISVWFKSQASATEHIYWQQETEIRHVNDNTIFVRMFNGTTSYTITTTTTFAKNQWHHVAFTYDTSNIRLYVDGIQREAETAATGNVTAGIGYIGRDEGTVTRLQGFVDETKVFASTLSAAQVKAEYAGGAAVLGQQDSKDFLSDGLVGYWKLDESSGNASDSSGNGLTLTNNAVMTYVGGKFGYGSEHVPASLQYLSTATTISGVKTVSFWTNPDATTDYYISLTSSAYITSSNGTLSATGFTSPTIYVNGTQTTTIIADSWQLVTVTTDTAINADTFYIGRQGSNYYDGTMDDVRVYNRALSSAEVKSLNNWAPGPVGYWKMDEGTGTAFNDVSGNSLGGTLPTATWRDGKYGKAATFAGDTAVANLSADSDLHDWINDLTIEGWVYFNSNPTAGNYEYFFVKGNPYNNSGVGYSANYSNSILGIYYNDGQDPASNCTSIGINVGDLSSRWTHIAVAFKKSTTKIDVYKNGVLATSGTPVCTGNFNSSTALKLGGVGSSNSGLNGSLDDVRIYNYSRTMQQIVEDMNAGHPTGGSPVGTQLAYWKFDEMNEDTVNDSVGSYNGNLNGSCPGAATCPTWTASGKFNSALSFDGGDSVDFGDMTITESASQLSVSAWVKPSSAGSIRCIVCKFANAAGQTSWSLQTYTVSGTSTKFYVGIPTSSSDNSTFAETDNYVLANSQWTHIAMTFDGTQTNNSGRLKLYINGQAQAVTYTGTIPAATAASASNVTIGSNYGANGRFFIGSIDDVKVYTSPLTAEQIKIDYNNGRAINFGGGVDGSADTIDGAITPPVGYWPLDENTGTVTAYDKSGNGKNGTLTSITEAAWSPGKYGSSLTLDGSADFVDIGTGPSTVNSVTFWVKPTTTTEYFVNLTSTTDYIWANGGTVTATGFTAPTIYVDGIATTTMSAGSWHHIAVVSSTAENASNLDIGRTEDSNYLEGLIDDVKLFNFALTQAQVAYEFNRGEPYAWFKFDECTGTTANNSGSASGLSGTITPQSLDNTSAGNCSSGTGTEMWNDGTSGKFNGSLGFDGDDDFVSLGDNALGSMTGTFTLAAWVKLTGNTARTVLSEYETSVCGDGLLRITSGLASFHDGGATTNTSTETVNDGNWHNIVYVYNGSTGRFYIDGKIQSDTTAATWRNICAATNVRIGSLISSEYFDGQIDDVRVYKYALSADQVKNVINEGKAVKF